MSKKVKRGNKEFQDLVDEMLVDLVHQDMEAAGEEARRKAEKEHEASLSVSHEYEPVRYHPSPRDTPACRRMWLIQTDMLMHTEPNKKGPSGRTKQLSTCKTGRKFH